MADKILLDTNVLVYAYDRSEPAKQNRALEILDQAYGAGFGALTTQVLGEFFTVVTGKIASPLSKDDAAHQVALFVRAWRVIDISAFTILEAVRGACT